MSLSVCLSVSFFCLFSVSVFVSYCSRGYRFLLIVLECVYHCLMSIFLYTCSRMLLPPSVSVLLRVFTFLAAPQENSVVTCECLYIIVSLPLPLRLSECTRP